MEIEPLREQYYVEFTENNDEEYDFIEINAHSKQASTMYQCGEADIQNIMEHNEVNLASGIDDHIDPDGNQISAKGIETIWFNAQNSSMAHIELRISDEHHQQMVDFLHHVIFVLTTKGTTGVRGPSGLGVDRIDINTTYCESNKKDVCFEKRTTDNRRNFIKRRASSRRLLVTALDDEPSAERNSAIAAKLTKAESLETSNSHHVSDLPDPMRGLSNNDDNRTRSRRIPPRSASSDRLVSGGTRRRLLRTTSMDSMELTRLVSEKAPDEGLSFAAVKEESSQTRSPQRGDGGVVGEAAPEREHQNIADRVGGFSNNRRRSPPRNRLFSGGTRRRLLRTASMESVAVGELVSEKEPAAINAVKEESSQTAGGGGGEDSSNIAHQDATDCVGGFNRNGSNNRRRSPPGQHLTFGETWTRPLRRASMESMSVAELASGTALDKEPTGERDFAITVQHAKVKSPETGISNCGANCGVIRAGEVPNKKHRDVAGRARGLAIDHSDRTNNRRGISRCASSDVLFSGGTKLLRRACMESMAATELASETQACMDARPEEGARVSTHLENLFDVKKTPNDENGGNNTSTTADPSNLRERKTIKRRAMSSRRLMSMGHDDLATAKTNFSQPAATTERSAKDISSDGSRCLNTGPCSTDREKRSSPKSHIPGVDSSNNNNNFTDRNNRRNITKRRASNRRLLSIAVDEEPADAKTNVDDTKKKSLPKANCGIEDTFPYENRLDTHLSGSKGRPRLPRRASIQSIAVDKHNANCSVGAGPAGSGPTIAATGGGNSRASCGRHRSLSISHGPVATIGSLVMATTATPNSDHLFEVAAKRPVTGSAAASPCDVSNPSSCIAVYGADDDRARASSEKSHKDDDSIVSHANRDGLDVEIGPRSGLPVTGTEAETAARQSGRGSSSGGRARLERSASSDRLFSFRGTRLKLSRSLSSDSLVAAAAQPADDVDPPPLGSISKPNGKTDISDPTMRISSDEGSIIRFLNDEDSMACGKEKPSAEHGIKVGDIMPDYTIRRHIKRRASSRRLTFEPESSGKVDDHVVFVDTCASKKNQSQTLNLDDSTETGESWEKEEECPDSNGRRISTTSNKRRNFRTRRSNSVRLNATAA